jgi:hypothetical protein
MGVYNELNTSMFGLPRQTDSNRTMRDTATSNATSNSLNDPSNTSLPGTANSFATASNQNPNGLYSRSATNGLPGSTTLSRNTPITPLPQNARTTAADMFAAGKRTSGSRGGSRIGRDLSALFYSPYDLATELNSWMGEALGDLDEFIEQIRNMNESSATAPAPTKAGDSISNTFSPFS